MQPAPKGSITLARHPDTPCDAVRSFSVRVLRVPGGALAATYVLQGDIPRLRIPQPRHPCIGERLWQHTCFEIFVAVRMPAYHEFNFAPSGEWAAYVFERYREGAALNDQALAPGLTVRSAADKLEIDVSVRLDRLSPAHVASKLLLGISAVIEDQAGGLSYWALLHPSGKPDFHHPDAFSLELE